MLYARFFWADGIAVPQRYAWKDIHTMLPFFRATRWTAALLFSGDGRCGAVGQV